MSYDEARGRGAKHRFDESTIARPSFCGLRTLSPSLDEVARYIDWTPFFHAWELSGVYPAILDDPKVGKAARELFASAEEMLARLMSEHSLEARAVYGFFPAASRGDDIVLFEDEARTRERLRFHTLRQQSTRDREDLLALADFVAPQEGALCDYVGGFAVGTGFGLDAVLARLRAEHDDFGAILAQALADRLAEALAELVHERARADCKIADRERGIRPAAGYPACPDHTEKAALFELLEASARTGLVLTESYAMWPAAAVCGLYFNHPEARYFTVGKIGADQVASYAARKGVSVAVVERWLATNLAYL